MPREGKAFGYKAAEAGKVVKYRVTPVYANGAAKTPKEIHLEAWVEGKPFWQDQPIVIPNVP